MITITIEDRNGERQDLELPTDISLSLMEVLKGSDYNILATCGGMALCATCHVEVLNHSERLSEPQDMELDMLDTLPDAGSSSRLACQLRISDEMDGITFRIRGDEN